MFDYKVKYKCLQAIEQDSAGHDTQVSQNHRASQAFETPQSMRHKEGSSPNSKRADDFVHAARLGRTATAVVNVTMAITRSAQTFVRQSEVHRIVSFF